MLSRWVVLAYYCVNCSKSEKECDAKFSGLFKYFSSGVEEAREAVDCLAVVKSIISGKTVLNIHDIINNGLPDFSDLPKPKNNIIQNKTKKDMKDLIRELKKELEREEKNYENAEWNGGQLYAENCEKRIKDLRYRLKLYKADLHKAK